MASDVTSDATSGATSDARFTSLLAVTALGVYLLVVLGLTNAVATSASACTAWPICTGALAEITDQQVAIALGHRAVALVVGVLVVWSTVWALRRQAGQLVTGALLVALVLYPIQIAVGALVATSSTDPGAAVAGVHLAFGLAIFLAIVAALAWALEAQTASPSDRRPVETESRSPAADAGSPTALDLPDDVLARASLRARAYLRMTKPRLMWLLCLVAVAGMALAAGPALDLRAVALTLGGGVLAIGASGTFNNVLERDVDRRMDRTSDRPLAADLIPVERAVAFGLVLAASSIALFVQINRLAALLGLVAIVYYSVVYTLLLKPNTVQNTVVGGAAGALPALIGWAAVTNEIGLPALALAGLIFLWTPAHFYNLALAYKEDYARGGFPMLPVVRGEAVARKHVLFYLGATLAAAAILNTASDLGLLYALASVVGGAVFLWAAIRLHREQTEAAALRSFHASNAFLGLVLVAIVVDAIVL